MSNTPIFDQINAKFRARGADYESLVSEDTPAFVWPSVRPTVSLDKKIFFVMPLSERELA